MENVALYIAKACGLTAMFYCAYYLLLRKETFFRANRWFLLLGIATSVLLPLAVYTKVVWIEPEPVEQVQLAFNTVDFSLEAPAQQAAIAMPVQQRPVINWWLVGMGIYIAGAALLFTRLIIDFKRVYSFFKGQDIMKFGKYKIIDSETAQSPFSFFNYIIYNSAALEPGELQGILSHEKVHSRQRHSIDMIAAQLFCAAFWFNPFVWLYKKAVSQNLEYIADNEAVKYVTDVTAYQKTMLKMTLNSQNSAITSHFYQPLIKKRIIMINKPKSKKSRTVKYAVVLPLLALFVGLFQIKTEAREKALPAVAFTQPADTLKFTNIKFTVTKNTTDENLKESTELIAKTYKIDASCSDVVRNNKKEITAITVTLKGQGVDKAYKENSSNPIKDFTISVGRNANGELQAEIYSTATKKDEAESADTPEITINGISNNDAKKELDNALIVIDGIKQPKGVDWSAIDPNKIAAITVYKNDKQTVEKYGDDAKNGVIEIKMKDTSGGYQIKTSKNTNFKQDFDTESNLTPGQLALVRNNPGKVYVTSTTTKAYTTKSRLDDIKNGDEIDYKKAYILLNGEQITSTQFESLKDAQIYSISTSPTGNSKVYGPQAANGLIEIVTKDKPVEIRMKGTAVYTEDESNDVPQLTLEDNSGFIVHKTSTESELQYYAKALEKMGIRMKTSGIKRNANGEITSIKIELTKDSNKASTNIKSDKPIKDQYVGTRNGYLIVKAEK